MTMPPASTSSRAGGSSGPRETIRPSFTPTPPSRTPEGVTTSPFLMARSITETQLGGVGEGAGALFSQDHHVLNPYPAPAGEIDARLHGEYHPLRQDVLGAGSQARALVGGQPCPVAQAVAKGLPVARLLNDLPGQAV